MRRLVLALFAGMAAGVVEADEFWIEYDGNVPPEQDGWTRYHNGGPVMLASQPINGGGYAWVIDTLAYPQTYNHYTRDVGLVLLKPGENFVAEWRVMVHGSIDDSWLNIADMNLSGGFGATFGQSSCQIAGTTFAITPLEFHTYRVESSDLKTFHFSLDGKPLSIYTSPVSMAGVRVLFGDWTSGGFGTPTSRGFWDYVHFGVTDGCHLVGDLNGDDKVDQTDLAILLATFGCPSPQAPPPCLGDVDGDSDTDQADLGLLLANFGAACP